MVFTNKGIQEIILTALNGGAISRPTYIAVGTDDTTATEEDIALGDEKSRTIIATTTTGTNTVVFSMTITSGQNNGDTLKEVGTFSASTSGVCSARTTHSSIVKTNSLEVEYIFTFKVTN